MSLMEHHEYSLFQPIWKEFQREKVEGHMVGWTLLYSLPETSYTIMSKSLQWVKHRAFYSIINMAVAVSKQCAIVTLGPRKTFRDLTDAFDSFNSNLPVCPLQENNGRMTGIESQRGLSAVSTRSTGWHATHSGALDGQGVQRGPHAYLPSHPMPQD